MEDPENNEELDHNEEDDNNNDSHDNIDHENAEDNTNEDQDHEDNDNGDGDGDGEPAEPEPEKVVIPLPLFANTKEAAEWRGHFFSNSTIRAYIKKFWNMIPKDAEHRISRDDYISLNMLVSKFLLPNFEEKPAYKVAELEWEHDVKGFGGVLTYEAFYHFLFEIFDFWAKGMTIAEFVEVAKAIFLGITKESKEESMSINPASVQRPTTSQSERSSNDEGDEGDDGVDDEGAPVGLTVVYNWAQLLEVDSGKYPFFERNSKIPEIQGGTRPEELEKKPLSTIISTWPISMELPPPISAREQDAYESEEELEQLYKSACPSILLLGKPFSGKTSLAAKVASALGLVHLEVASILSRETKNKSEIGKELESYLKAGGVMREQQRMQLYDSVAHAPETLLRGYVLDGDPQSVQELMELQTWQCRPQYAIVLDPPDTEILFRVGNARADPDTGLVRHTVTKNRNAKNLAPPKKKKKKEGEEGEEGEEEEEEEEEEAEEEEGEEEGEGSSEEVEEGAESNKKMISLPEFSESALLQQLQDYATSFRQIERKLPLFFQEKNIFRISSTQSLSDLVKQTLDLLRNLDVVSVPISLPAPSQNNDDGKKKFLQDAELPDGLPQRQFTQWDIFCPVSYYLHHTLIPGNFDYATAFMGRVYMFANAKCKRIFEKNPKPFLALPPPLPHHKGIAVLGPPLSGKTTYAKMIAEKMGVPLLNVEELLLRHLAENTEIGQVAKQILHEGLPVPHDVYAQVVLQETLKQWRGTPTDWYGLPVGWVLDGFPQTLDQASALLDAEIVPSAVVVLQSDDEIVDRVKSADAEKLHLPLKDGLNMPRYTALKSWVENLEGVKSVFRKKRSGNSAPPPDIIEIPCIGFFPSIFGRIWASLDPCYLTPVETDGEELEGELEKLFGDTKFYCPVTLATKHTLVPGDPKLSARWRNYVYHFVGPEEQMNFMMAPHAYLPKSTPPVPAARIAVVGSKSSGKSSIAKYISNRWRLTYIGYNDLRAAKSRKERLSIKLSREAPMPDEEVIENLKRLLDIETAHGRGFVLDGLPQTSEQLRLLVGSRYFPDTILVLDLTESVSIKRLSSPPTSAQIDDFMDQIKNKLEDAGESVPSTSILRQQAIILARNDAEEALFEAFDAEQKGLKELEEVATEFSIPVTHVNANSKHSIVVERSVTALNLYLDQRSSMLTHAIAVKPEEARDLLETGAKSLSKFRFMCPVTLHEKCSQAFPQTKMVSFPVVYRRHLYYCSDEQQAKKFVTTPNLYISQVAPPAYDGNLHAQIVVIGPPRSGKTSIAKRLAQKLGITRLSLGKVLKIVAASNTAMGTKIGDLLREGELLWDEMYVEALEQVLGSQHCYPQGWILDGFPQNVVQAKLMIRKGIIPSNVINMDLDSDSCLERCKPDLESTKSDKMLYNCTEIIRDRIASYKQVENGIRDYFNDNYGNLLVLDARKSKWALYEQAEKIIRSSLHSQIHHLHAVRKNKPASLAYNKCNTQDVYRKLSQLSTYCPVSLRNGQFSDVLENSVKPNSRPPISNAVEYKGKIYFMKGETERDEFMRHPDLYADLELPSSLPQKVSVPKRDSLQLLGYCPVTLERGSGYERFVQGKDNLVLEYKNKYYAFADEASMSTFMATPNKYSDLVLPKKLPPPSLSIALESLPVMGYLEQTVASAISKSLLALIRTRPKLPRVSVKKSALYFLALHLKAHNPSSSKYLLSHADSQLQQFTEFSRLIPLLSKHISAATTHPPPSPSDLTLPSPRMLEKLLQVENSYPSDVKSFDDFQHFNLETLIHIPNLSKDVK